MNHHRELPPRQGHREHRQEPGSGVYGELQRKVSQVKKLESLDPDEMVRSADEIGKDLSHGRNSVKHAQVRHILDEVNRIRLEIRKRPGDLAGDLLARIKLLKPRFAYLAGRDNGLKPLYSVLSPMIDKTTDRHDFNRFAEFVQAVVAYHKFYGGSDR